MTNRTHCGSARSKISNGEMKEMRRNGYTIQDIAKRAGLPPTTVGCRLRTWGIKPDIPIVQKPKLNPDEYEKINRLYWGSERMSVGEVADALGLKEGTVLSRMQKGGIPRRSKAEGIRLAYAKGRYPSRVRRPEGRELAGQLER